MPLIFVQRWAPSGPVSVVGGTQYITGTLTLSGTPGDPSIIELDPAAFTQTGEYVLFDYSAGTIVYTPYASLQVALTAGVLTVDASDTGFTAGALTDYPAESKIKIVLS